MKNVLFATTALVATAGFASAQGVEISGSAEMGIFGGTGIETQFFQDIDVTFTMSGETDNGLTFGAAIDIDEVDAGTTAATGDVTDDGGVAIFISGDFGTLTMGDTDGAFDWALTEVAIGGSIADDHTAHIGYNGNAGLDGTYDGQVVRYDHSIGDFSFAVSVEADESGVGDPVLGIGGKWSGDLGGVNVGFGIGYQVVDSFQIVGMSATAAMDNGFEARVNYSVLEGFLTHVGIGVGYSMDALTIGANWGQFEAGGASISGFGLAANYDLGGGATVQFGYGNSDFLGVTANTWSLGVAMSF